MNLGELSYWCSTNSRVPDVTEPGQPFVVNFDWNWPEEKYTGLKADDKPNDFINPDGSPRLQGDKYSKGDQLRFFITT